MQQPTPRRRGRALGTALALAIATLYPATAALAQANVGSIASLDYLGRVEFNSRTATLGGTTIGGLSGIAYDAANNRYLALSDDPGNVGGAARFYTLDIDLSDGALNGGAVSNGATETTVGDVRFTGFTTLQQPGGGPFPATPLTIDPEGFALSPDGQSVWVTSEGYRQAGPPENVQQPFLRQYNLSGQQIGEIALPGRYTINSPSGPNANLGPLNNVVFESLSFNTFLPGGTRLYTATEAGLAQDGGAAAFNKPANSRIVEFDPGTGLRTREFLYRTDGVIRQPASGFSTAGLVDILFTGPDTFLALERSLTTNPNNAFPLQTNEVRLYEVSLAGATDIQNIDALTDDVIAGITGVQKRLLFDFNTALFDGQNIRIDNLEAITIGPRLADGSYSLIVASDDNFAPGGAQQTQIFAFRVNAAAVPEPGALGLAGAGLLPLAGLAVARRRRGK